MDKESTCGCGGRCSSALDKVTDARLVKPISSGIMAIANANGELFRIMPDGRVFIKEEEVSDNKKFAHELALMLGFKPEEVIYG